MPRTPLVPSEYRAMWIIALFDLPMKTKEQKKRYTRFRHGLLRLGFTMIQFSIYVQYCTSEEAAETKRRKVRFSLPREGQVRLLSVTDKQFARMEIYQGETPRAPESEPSQLTFF